jgi:signal transduction histidine kinase
VGLLIWVGIGAGLKTIRALIGEIRSRSPDDLSRLTLRGLPLDLVPLGRSINQLLTKLERSFTAEKRFAEHAAHHLRTPLAALKLQMQLLSHARDEDERNAMLADLTASIDRASRLVGQLEILIQGMMNKTALQYFSCSSFTPSMPRGPVDDVNDAADFIKEGSTRRGSATEVLTTDEDSKKSSSRT